MPSSCRYPIDRFSFYLYDKYESYGGSKEEYTYEEALALANNIANRDTQPSYMRKVPFSLINYLKIKRYRLEYMFSYFCGEHYCTPSPWRKWKLLRNRRGNVKKWDSQAKLNDWKNKIARKFVVMYPMQMQPEANIDVWGYPYKNQTETIKTISDQLHEDEVLVIKPNPKAKFELTDELLTLVKRDNIVIVPLNTPMSEVFSEAELVVVVTGTVAMECIVANKPVVTLTETMNNEQRNCPFLSNLNHLRPFIEKAKNGEYVRISDNEKVTYINNLVRTSYLGNPYGCYRDDNVITALKKVFEL